jgi:predicted nucleic acid-binding protein
LNGDTVLVDAGPLVAQLIRADAHHAWAAEQFEALQPPVLTCEPVLTEACHIIHRHGGDPMTVIGLVETNILQVAFTLDDHVPELLQLMRRYADLPMSLADACLVRLSELHRHCRVMTTDTDFRVKRPTEPFQRFGGCGISLPDSGNR